MTASTWAALLGACLLISLTPGAGAINTMNNALNVGFRRAIWGILGQQLALLIQLVIVALGLGLVVTNSPTAFAVIRYVGAAYLVYLGVKQIRAKPTAAGGDQTAAIDDGAWSMFTRGVWVNLLNPKAIVFLVAFIPGFVRSDGAVALQYTEIGATIVVVDLIIMWLFFALVGRTFRRVTGTPRGQRRLNIFVGVLVIGVGLMLVFL